VNVIKHFRKVILPKKLLYHFVTFALSAILICSTVYGAFASTDTELFSDIDGWYREAIEYNVELGFFHGTSEHMFSPNAPMTQPMVITVLGRLSEVYGKSIEVAPVGTPWQAKYTDWAIKAKIIPDNVPPPGFFTPDFEYNRTVSREEFSAYLCNILDYLEIKPPDLSYWFTNASGWNDNETPYPDMMKQDYYNNRNNYPERWAWPSYDVMRMARIIVGYPGYRDCPGAVITRAEACQMLMRICKEYIFIETNNENANTQKPADPQKQAYAYYTIFYSIFKSYINSSVDFKYVALDLSDVSISDTEHLIALAQGFCEENGLVLLLDTFSGLVEKGYIDIEKTGFSEGYLMGFHDIHLSPCELVTSASLWFGNLGAFFWTATVRLYNNSWEITTESDMMAA